MGDKTISCESLFEFISSCKVVISSSLHAIIFSHSLGVPAVFFSDINTYKVQDYYSVYDRINVKQATEKNYDDALSMLMEKDFLDKVNPTREEVRQV